MSASKDYCVSCEAPLVDETVKGDLTDGFANFSSFENALNDKTFANRVVGSKNGCRNCAVIMDALSFISRGKDQKRFEFTIIPRRESQTLDIEVEVVDDGDTELFFMEVFRQSSMSN
jgi:hypothetical protein